MSNRKFAEGTTVAVAKSRAEIETLLTRYGCTDFGYRIRESLALIQFESHGRHIRFAMPIPELGDDRFTYKAARGGRGGKVRTTPIQREQLHDAECRRLWRCLCLSIKAKLESVQSGISQFEDEFLAWTVDPQTGHTMSERVNQYLESAYQGRPVSGFLALPAPE